MEPSPSLLATGINNELSVARFGSAGLSKTPISDVARKIVLPNGEKWAGDADFTSIDRIMEPHLPLNSQRLVQETAEKLPAARIAKLSFANFVSIITPNRLLWVQSFAHMMISHYATTQDLRLYAVKGGPECDAEIEFIEKLMVLFGFSTVKFREGAHGQQHLTWNWKIDRQGVLPFNVILYQYSAVAHCHDVQIAIQAAPKKSISNQAPHLRRMAAVSAPIIQNDVKVAEELNRIIKDGLMKAMNRANSNINDGFYPETFEGMPGGQAEYDRLSSLRREYMAVA